MTELYILDTKKRTLKPKKIQIDSLSITFVELKKIIASKANIQMSDFNMQYESEDLTQMSQLKDWFETAKGLNSLLTIKILDKCTAGSNFLQNDA